MWKYTRVHAGDEGIDTCNSGLCVSGTFLRCDATKIRRLTARMFFGKSDLDVPVNCTCSVVSQKAFILWAACNKWKSRVMPIRVSRNRCQNTPLFPGRGLPGVSHQLALRNRFGSNGHFGGPADRRVQESQCSNNSLLTGFDIRTRVGWSIPPYRIRSRKHSSTHKRQPIIDRTSP